MVPNPLCPLLPLSPLGATKVACLQATVLLLLSQLIKARIQIKAFSTLGIVLLLLQTVVFLGVATTAAAAAFAVSQRRAAAARA